MLRNRLIQMAFVFVFAGAGMIWGVRSTAPASASSQIAYLTDDGDRQRLMLLDPGRAVQVEFAAFPSLTNGPPVWSPDGQWLAQMRFMGAQASLHVYDIIERREILIPMSGGYRPNFVVNFPLVWSPDSQQLLYVNRRVGDKGTIMLLDVRSGESSFIADDIAAQSTLVWPEGSAQAWRFVTLRETSDGRGSPIDAQNGPKRDGHLLWIDPQTQNTVALQVEPACAAFVPFPVVSPDGKRFVCPVLAADNDANRNDLFLYDLSTPGSYSSTRLSALEGNPERAAWSPDGRWLIFQIRSTGHADLYLVDTLTGEQDRLNTGFTQSSSPAWSPDGKQIAFSALQNGHTDIHLYELQSGSTRQLSFSPNNEHSTVWSPDGQWLFFMSDRENSIEDSLFVLPINSGTPRFLVESGWMIHDENLHRMAQWRP